MHLAIDGGIRTISSSMCSYQELSIDTNLSLLYVQFQSGKASSGYKDLFVDFVYKKGGLVDFAATWKIKQNKIVQLTKEVCSKSVVWIYTFCADIKTNLDAVLGDF